MIKPKDNAALKTIISLTKEETNSNNKSINNDVSKIKNNENPNQENVSEQLKSNVKLKDNNNIEGHNLEENDDEDEGRKYYEFNAHFKYQELVEALNALQNKKNESTSNTSNANINNNINNKTSIKNSNKDNKNNCNITNNCNNTSNNNNNVNNNNNCILNKPYNYKVISRNIQMNNYIKYLEYIEENKDNNVILTSIANNIQQNKTSFLPQTELLKKKIDLNLQKLNELKHQNQEKI